MTTATMSTAGLFSTRHPSHRVRLLYTCPAEGFDHFVARLLACSTCYADQLELCRLEHPAALARSTRFAAFVSPTQPTVVLMRGDDVIGEVIGDVPSNELHRSLRRALDGD